MRKIDKGQAPDSLNIWIRKKSSSQSESERYNQIHDDKRYTILDDVIKTCTKEQFYLCAYCCQRISGAYEDTMGEHVEARKLVPKRSLDFSNFVASCKTLKQCDSSHGSQELPLTPFMAECETELKFKLSGRVEGLSKRAKTAVAVLNLGDTELENKALIEKRKNLVDALIWKNYLDDPINLQFEEDKELIEMFIEDLKQPIDGKLEAYSPVLVNILSQMLDNL